VCHSPPGEAAGSAGILEGFLLHQYHSLQSMDMTQTDPPEVMCAMSQGGWEMQNAVAQ